MTHERRRAGRRRPGAGEPLSRLRLRGGRELLVQDISSAGTLVEGSTRLLPGTHVDVHLVTIDGRTLVRCRVVRASVCALSADVVRYRTALAFERMVDTSARGYAIPEVFGGPFLSPGIDYPAADATAHAESSAAANTHSIAPVRMASGLEPGHASHKAAVLQPAPLEAAEVA